MIVLQIGLCLIHMCLIPYFIGTLLLAGDTRERNLSVSWRMATGLMVSYTIFEGLVLALQKLGKGFRLVTTLYGVITVCLALCGLALWIYRKEIKTWTFRWNKDVFFLLAVVLIGIQIGMVLFMATTDQDDAFYSGLSSMCLSYDYLLEFDAYSGQMDDVISARYMVSALPVYQASLTLFSGGLHHLFITHNLFPLFYIPLAYGVYYQIGKDFLEKEEGKGAEGKFLFFIALLHMIGNYYVFSSENFLVTRMWQGKALFAALGIPVLWRMGEQALTAGLGADKEGKWIRFRNWLLVMCTLIAMAFMGETGLFLGPFMLGCLTLAGCFVHKKPLKLVPAVLCCVPSLLLMIFVILS